MSLVGQSGTPVPPHCKVTMYASGVGATVAVQLIARQPRIVFRATPQPVADAWGAARDDVTSTDKGTDSILASDGCILGTITDAALAASCRVATKRPFSYDDS